MINGIPIKNIYYMLSYSVGILPEKKETDVSGISEIELLDLYAEALLKRLISVNKRGVYKEYILEEESISSLKGKILFKESISKTTMLKAQLVCQFDEFSANVLHNQILKATIYKLICHKHLAANLRKELKRIYYFFSDQL